MSAIKEKIIHFLLRYCIPTSLLLLGRSIRFRWINDQFTREKAARKESCIYCFWHNRFLLMPYIYQRYRGGKNICVMASLSKDGEYISDVLGGFGFEVARGSSSRGGEGAIMDMAAMLERGLDAAVTPDGPRGPVYRVQPGVIMLSQASGIPIVPASYDVTRKKRLKSWDRFIIPAPFSRAVLVYGDPIVVPNDADEAKREELRVRLENSLRDLNAKAASLLGVEGD
ncbi:MAG: lysophospholipid acyltransferase family protein [Candidatus Aureabacteria bacterium]|nr:lysophospholipid acyltransferase family protein [Candidatus Auribacterota bacterium]